MNFGSFNGDYDPDLERIHNLFCFNINFSKYVHNEELWKQSPCYILDKYDHWIGFQNQIVIHKIPECIKDFMNKYHKTWGNSINSIIPQLVYLKLTENLNPITMVTFFEEYLGQLSDISPYKKSGLHPKLYDFMGTVSDKNNDNITLILRDMKLGQLI